MNVHITPELVIALIGFVAAGVSHWRISRIPEQVKAAATIAAAEIIADALVAKAKLKAEADAIK